MVKGEYRWVNLSGDSDFLKRLDQSAVYSGLLPAAFGRKEENECCGLNTTMRACEIKALRWYDVDFLAGTVTIRRSKTEAGQRVIPLNEDALSAIRELYLGLLR